MDLSFSYKFHDMTPTIVKSVSNPPGGAGSEARGTDCPNLTNRFAHPSTEEEPQYVVFSFEVPVEETYDVTYSAKGNLAYGAGGDIYLDDVEIFSGYKWAFPAEVESTEIGKVHLTAGSHKIKFVCRSMENGNGRYYMQHYELLLNKSPTPLPSAHLTTEIEFEESTGQVAVSGSIDSGEGKEISVSLIGPSGQLVDDKGVKSSANGEYAATFTVSQLSESGEYTVSVTEPDAYPASGTFFCDMYLAENQEEDKSKGNLVAEDFSGMQWNQAPGNDWNFVTSTISASDGGPDGDVKVVTVGGRKVLRVFDHNPKQERNAIKPFAEAAGVITVWFRIRALQTDVPVRVIIGNPLGKVAAQLVMNNTGFIAYQNGVEVVDTKVAYDPSSWCEIEAVLNTEAKTYDFAVNGALQESDLPFVDGSVDSLSALKFFVGKEDQGAFYIDAVNVSGTPKEVEYGAPELAAGDPIGGGAGYSKLVARQGSAVKTVAELKARLAEAVPGEVIYIDDDAELNLTNENTLSIPAGITLASGRGRNGSFGALLYSDNFSRGVTLLTVGGEGVRITGLRLRGPDGTIGHYPGASPFQEPNSDAIKSSVDVEVDNCEIYNFSEYGVYLVTGQKHQIHHNYFHHIMRSGLGYPVAVYNDSFAYVEGNLFDWFRHAVAGGNGKDGSGYLIRWNVFKRSYNPRFEYYTHTLDMHQSRPSAGNNAAPAGDLMMVYENTFEDEDSPIIQIRGLPSTGLYVFNNWFKGRPAPGGAVMSSSSAGNFWVAQNAYGNEKKVHVGKVGHSRKDSGL